MWYLQGQQGQNRGTCLPTPPGLGRHGVSQASRCPRLGVGQVPCEGGAHVPCGGGCLCALCLVRGLGAPWGVRVPWERTVCPWVGGGGVLWEEAVGPVAGAVM